MRNTSIIKKEGTQKIWKIWVLMDKNDKPLRFGEHYRPLEDLCESEKGEKIVPAELSIKTLSHR